MKVLNLYAGIGGNRKLWQDVEVTAIEWDKDIAAIYKDYFPDDMVVIADAHQYLLDHYKEFDFIWSSPPCPTHSKLRYLQKKKVYPDIKIYQEILMLKHWFKAKWIVENVIPYYEPLIIPTANLHRHIFWSNFPITYFKTKQLKTGKAKKERQLLQKEFGFNLDRYKDVDKRLLLRNCVNPKLGLHIFNCGLKDKQKVLIQ